MLKSTFLNYSMVFLLSLSSYMGLAQQNHSFVLDPTSDLDNNNHLLNLIYTPNKKDFLVLSYSNYLTEPTPYSPFVKLSRTTIGYMRSIFRTKNESLLYGHILYNIYPENSRINARAGFGWMQSLGKNTFLDFNANIIYQKGIVNSPTLVDREEFIFYLPIRLRSFLHFSDIAHTSYELPNSKWRIRNHQLEFVAGESRLIMLNSDVNIGYKLKDWLVAEGYVRGVYNFKAPETFSLNQFKSGIGLTLQPIRWKRLVPLAGISVGTQYAGTGFRQVTDIKRFELASDVYLGLEFKINAHYSWTIHRNFNLTPNSTLYNRKWEIGSVFHF